MRSETELSTVVCLIKGLGIPEILIYFDTIIVFVKIMDLQKNYSNLEGYIGLLYSILNFHEFLKIIEITEIICKFGY